MPRVGVGEEKRWKGRTALFDIDPMDRRVDWEEESALSKTLTRFTFYS